MAPISTILIALTLTRARESGRTIEIHNIIEARGVWVRSKGRGSLNGSDGKNESQSCNSSELHAYEEKGLLMNEELVFGCFQ
jgi:hypothetical protein